ncbi:MAG TPA: hypothetical protein PLC59_04650 [Bacteroidales bacterium]|nr:hypothetical protein [Bacteroidales bacterium]HQI45323.1 hypothetical protein [Bacteroidales bacterium]
MPKSNKKYLILGEPDGKETKKLFWNKELSEWVTLDKASYYGEEIWLFPPWELPIGGRGILNIETKDIFIPRASLGGEGGLIGS